MTDVLLFGNPNTGKTTLFNSLTNSNERASNWNGVTVETKNKTVNYKSNKLTFFDLPGVNSVEPETEEEIVSVRALEQEYRKGAYVCLVCDAVNLKKGLGIAVELQQKGVEFDIAINMINIHNGDTPTIVANVYKLYTGIIDFHPSSPAFLNTFHNPMIANAEIAKPTTANIPNIANKTPNACAS